MLAWGVLTFVSQEAAVIEPVVDSTKPEAARRTKASISTKEKGDSPWREGSSHLEETDQDECALIFTTRAYTKDVYSWRRKGAAQIFKLQRKLTRNRLEEEEEEKRCSKVTHSREALILLFKLILRGSVRRRPRHQPRRAKPCGRRKSPNGGA